MVENQEDGFIQKKSKRRSGKRLAKTNETTSANWISIFDALQRLVEITVKSGPAFGRCQELVGDPNAGCSENTISKCGKVGDIVQLSNSFGRRREIGVPSGRQAVQHKVLGRRRQEAVGFFEFHG